MNKLTGLSTEELGTNRMEIYLSKVLNFRKMMLKNCFIDTIVHKSGITSRSESLMLTLPESGPAKLRQLLKYLRFNKLLAKIVRDHKKNRKTLILKIDGPLSLFVQTQKYGLNLVNFFAAVLLQPKWKIDVQIRILKNKVHSLNLDESCGIRSHLNSFYLMCLMKLRYSVNDFRKIARLNPLHLQILLLLRKLLLQITWQLINPENLFR